MTLWKFYAQYDSIGQDVDRVKLDDGYDPNNDSSIPNTIVAINTVGFRKSKIAWPLRSIFIKSTSGIWIRSDQRPSVRVTHQTDYGVISKIIDPLQVVNPEKYWNIGTLQQITENVKYNDAIVIGAGFGSDAFYYIRCLQRVIAFELDSIDFGFLTENNHKNSSKFKLFPSRVGIWDKTGQVENQELFPEKFSKQDNKITVNTIDNITTDMKINLCILHCNTRHNTDKIFSGAKIAIEKYKPVIYCKRLDQATMDYLLSLGYHQESLPNEEILLKYKKL